MSIKPGELQILVSGRIENDQIQVELDLNAVVVILGVPKSKLAKGIQHFTSPFTLRNRGVEAKLISGSYKPEPDRALINALVQAHDWVAQIRAGTPMLEIAKQTDTHESVLRTRIRLALLSPRIQAAIKQGTQPTELTLAKLERTPVSHRWNNQEQQLGLN